MTADPAAVAATVTGRAVAAATVTRRSPIVYDPYLPGRVVERVEGRATTPDGEAVAWSAVVKRTRGVDLRAARRELAAYRQGIASPDPAAGLRAPRLLAWDDGDTGIELWLEALRDDHDERWPIVRFGAAARHIATWDVRRWFDGLPPTFDAEDAWAERHGQPDRVGIAMDELDSLASAAGAAHVMTLLDDPGFGRLRVLMRSTVARIGRLARLPVAPLHHDLVRSNLFALGDAATVAIDWENVGRGPFGVDLAPLVIGSVRRGEASADDLTAIETLVLAEYVGGIRDAGLDREADVRGAYGDAIGLRWHVVLGTVRACLDPATWGMRGSRRDEPREEALRHLLALSRHILATADERPTE